eukprot:3099947-Rhodomonas_salina.1
MSLLRSFVGQPDKARYPLHCPSRDQRRIVDFNRGCGSAHQLAEPSTHLGQPFRPRELLGRRAPSQRRLEHTQDRVGLGFLQKSPEYRRAHRGRKSLIRRHERQGHTGRIRHRRDLPRQLLHQRAQLGDLHREEFPKLTPGWTTIEGLSEFAR